MVLQLIYILKSFAASAKQKNHYLSQTVVFQNCNCRIFAICIYKEVRGPVTEWHMGLTDCQVARDLYYP